MGPAPATLSELEDIFARILQASIPFAGIVLFIILVMGGFKYITSSGDAQKAAAAKNTITYAIIGVIIVATAYIIIQMVSYFTGQTAILNFQIYRP